MKNNTSYKSLFTSLALVLCTILSGIIFNFLTNNGEINKWLSDHGVRTKELVIGTITISLLLLFLAYLQIRYSHSAEPITETVEPEVKRLFDSLRLDYDQHCTTKLEGRSEIPLEAIGWGGTDSQTINVQINENISINKAREEISEAFEDERRLLIFGNAGAGKTILLLRLALDLLNKISEDKLVGVAPMPIIFNLDSWSSEYGEFKDWLIAMLVSDGIVSKNIAITLVEEHLIIPLLDGLNELAREENTDIANEKRTACLKSLARYATHAQPIVVCCRVEEFSRIYEPALHGKLFRKKVEILSLPEAQVLSSLKAAASDIKNDDFESANHLLNLLVEQGATSFLDAFLELSSREQDVKYGTSADMFFKMVVNQEYSNLLKVLRTPFYFTTALEVLDQITLEGKDIPKDEDAIERYLMGKYIEGKLITMNDTVSPEKAKRWLKWLAILMKRRGIVSFDLSVLRVTDLKKRWAYTLGFSLLSGLFIALFFGPVWGLLSLLASTWFFNVNKEIQTEDNIELDFSKLATLRYWVNIMTTFFLFLFGTIFLWLIFFWIFGSKFGLLGILVFGMISGLSAGFFGGLVVGFNKLKSIKKFVFLKNPYQKLYGGFRINLIFVVSLFSVLFCLLILLLKSAPGITLISLFFVSVLLSRNLLPLLLHHALIQHSILRLYFYFEGSMPLKYATFLNCASEAGILEREGGRWRFRHENLQEYVVNNL